MSLTNSTGMSSLNSGSTQVDSPELTIEDIKKNKNAQTLGAWVQSVYSEMKSSRQQIQLSWCMNLSMYYGKQYTELLPRNGRLVTPPAPRYRVRTVVNRIRPAIRTELARLTSQKPSASVVPASSDDEDLFAAYAGEQVWESLTGSSHGNLAMHFNQTAFWLAITGVGFLKTWWNPDKLDKDNNNMPGDIEFGCVTPFHLFVPDLREVSLEGQPYIVNAYVKPLQWVKQYYGDNLNFDPVPDVVASNEILEDVYLGLGNAGKTQPDSVLCLELWAKEGAHPLLPNGGMIHVINRQVVSMYPDGIPYSHGLYPFTKFEHIPTGKFYPDSVITDITPLQREYNRGRSQVIENKNRMAKLNYVYAAGSIDPSKITTEPGQAIPYKLGMPPPQQMPLQPLPAYVMQDLDRTLMDLEDITGQHQVSKGGVPPGVTAATAISYLQERDDSLLNHTYTSIEQGMEDVAKKTLSLVVQYWDIPRMVRVTGATGAFDSFMLSGAKLQNGTDIRMEGGSSLPTSKAARQAFIMDLMKMGFISPQDGLKILDIGGVQKLYETLKVDESQAQRENIKLKRLTPEEIQGQQEQFQMMQQQGDPSTLDTQTGQPLQPPPPVAVNTWDNHDVHIRIHNNYRKTQAFELLSEEVKAAFEQHVQAHMAAITSAMQEVQQFQQQAGGMPTPPVSPQQGPEEEATEPADNMQEEGMEGPPPGG